MKIHLYRITPASRPEDRQNVSDAFKGIMDFKERYLENPLENMHVILKRNYVTNTRLGLALHIEDSALGLVFDDSYYCLKAKRVSKLVKDPPELSVYKSIYKRHSGIWIYNNSQVKVVAYDPDMREDRVYYLNGALKYSNFAESTIIALNRYIDRKNAEYLKQIRKENNELRRQRISR